MSARPSDRRSSARSIVPCIGRLPDCPAPRLAPEGVIWANYIPLRAPEQGRVWRIWPHRKRRSGRSPFSALSARDKLMSQRIRLCATSRHSAGGRPTMIPNAHRMFNFDLGETADAIRETVQQFLRQRDRAARRRDRQEQSISPRPLAQDRRARPARHYRRGGIWRNGARLSRTLHRGRGNFAGVGGGRPVLRRAFQPLRQPDPPQRQRGAEAEIPAEADLRRTCRLTGDVGARRRLRRGVDEDARRQEGRPLRHQRQQDVDHQRPGRRYAGGLCQDRSRRRSARHHRLHHRKGHEGIFHRAKARQARHARLRHLRTGVRQLRSAGGERARARSAAASTC